MRIPLRVPLRAPPIILFRAIRAPFKVPSLYSRVPARVFSFYMGFGVQGLDLEFRDMAQGVGSMRLEILNLKPHMFGVS